MPSEASARLSRIDLRHLRYFVAIAEARSISSAAEALHMSQPPLSMQMKELESTLGVQLFVRHRSGVSLTEPGKAMLDEARSVLDRALRAYERVLQIGRGEAGEIRIGLVSSIMWTRFPDLLSEFRHRFPDVHWTLDEMTPGEQVSALLDHRIDVGFWRSERPATPGLKAQRFMKEELCVALPASHSLARSRRIRLADLRDEPYLSADMRWATVGIDLEDALRSLDFQPRVARAVREPQTLMALVGNGLGFTLMPASLKRIPWPGVVFKPVAERLPRTDPHLHVRDADLSPTTLRFIEVVNAHARD